MFDEAKATSYVHSVDRDRAPYFEGRKREISVFHSCLDQVRDSVESGVSPSSMIRIYQGAPGCGKTSLINHLRDTNEEILFIELTPSSLESVDNFITTTTSKLEEVRNSGLNLLQNIAFDGLASIKFNNSVEFLKRVLQRLPKIPPVVLYVDEAQILGPIHGDSLLDIYRGTVGLPTMLLLTGLTYTKNSITAIQGLLRLPIGSVINMGKMSDEECMTSTLKLLADLNVEGTDGEQEIAATNTIRYAFGWPQHLKCAQTALCNELLRVSGKVAEVDYETVETKTTEMRAEYYMDRLGGSVLAHETLLTTAVTTIVTQLSDVKLGQLEAICAACINTPELIARKLVSYDPVDLAHTLISKGVLAQNDKGTYEPSIPSMVTWLQEQNNLPPDFSIATN